ncbi:fibronectin type III domain-containing protein [Nocardioides ochotonae]|uniref:fibronectin type III domain-containing protein n=1 Tax=Nocardioides ochotonae TaxID=2685869 RepID=UPI0021E1AB59|nr:fibronectin type III domain-containing protein [Nocardioides ochotonae]
MSLNLAMSALLGLGVLSSTPAAADPAQPSPSEPGAVRIAEADPLLEESQNGRKAIRELGDQLPTAAAHNDMAPAELRTLLRTDDTLWVDPQGALFYVDPAPETLAEAPSPLVELLAPLEETFALHSNPGANLTILLDFDGQTVSSTTWNNQNGLIPATHPAWDPASDGPGFSDGERRMIQQVWAMVAEDYAPFGVDVTTEDPGDAALVRTSSTDAEYGTRVLITPSDDAHLTLCSRSCGGVAYVNVFDRIAATPLYQPAWVFPQALGGSAKNVAEAATHEAGHNLALNHDGTSTQGYYAGHGIWAPIMGVGYSAPLAQWSAGSYPDASNPQDDVRILTGHLGARSDEAPSSVSAPATLPAGEAFVGTADDVDTYLLGTCTAGADVVVRTADLAPNLDVRAVLHDAAGTERASAQPRSSYGDGTTAAGTGAALTVPTAGDGWVLAIDGVGQDTWTTGGYDDYGSLGAYTIEVSGCDGETAAGAPGTPRDVAATSAERTLTLTWSAPETQGDGPVTGYLVTRSGSAETQTLPADARSHTFTGLEVGTTYQLSVRAVNGTGAGQAVTVNATTAPPPPATPSAPRQVTGSYDHASGKILAWWVEPETTGTAPITGYAIHLDGVNIGQLDPTSRGAELTRAGGFAVGSYVVGIAALNAAGSSPTASVTIRVEPPANDDVAAAEVLRGTNGTTTGNNALATRETTDPVPPSAYGAGGFSVWYAWTPSSDGTMTVSTSGGADNRDTTLAAYTGTPGALEEVAGNDDDDARFHARITFEARAGTRYLLAVDGFSTAGGTGPFVLAWDQVVATPPSAPERVRAVRGDQSATVSWDPAGANGSPVTGYTVVARTAGSLDRTVSVDGSTTTTVFTGLTNGAAYTFTVTATNAVGGSLPSTPSNEVTPAGIPTTVAKPTAVRGDRSATVSWNPATGNGSPITGYTVLATPGAHTKTVDASSRATTITGLTNGTAYTFTVTATNAIGDSIPSAVSNEVTPAGVPTTVAKPTAVRGDRSATVSWDPAGANGSPVTGYTVTALTAGKPDRTVSVDGSTTTTVLTGLTNGAAYTFTVTATNAVGDSAPSAASNGVTPAGIPTAVTTPTAVRGNQSSVVSWAPATGNGSPITSYTVLATPGDHTATVDAATRTTTITGLSNGTAYTFTVTATNAIGDSIPSAPSNEVIPAGIPSTVTTPTAVRGDRSTTVSWDPVAGNGSPVTGYTVTARTTGKPDRTVSVEASATTAVFTGLTNGSAYTFTVTASNTLGDSIPSAPSVVVVPAGKPTTTPKPTVSLKGRVATIRWRPASGNGLPVLRYVVQRIGGPRTTSSTSPRKVVFRGLQPGVHRFRVTAVNALGKGKPSAPVRVRIRR